jgi:hypothetical protein
MPPFKPYASSQQERWAHTPEGMAALGDEDVNGKDQMSKGMSLPKVAAPSASPIKKFGKFPKSTPKINPNMLFAPRMGK